MLPANCRNKTYSMFKLYTSCKHSLRCGGANYTLSDVRSPLQHRSCRVLLKQCCASHTEIPKCLGSGLLTR